MDCFASARNDISRPCEERSDEAIHPLARRLRNGPSPGNVAWIASHSLAMTVWVVVQPDRLNPA
jgi:hypothetical protein